MAISGGECTTNHRQMELKEHGSISFPIGCYADELTAANVPWHWHDELEYVIVAEGELLFLMENARFSLKSGEGIFINSGALHAMENVSGRRGELKSAVFHARLVGGSMDSLFWQTLVHPLLQDTALQYLVLRPEVAWQGQVIDCFYQTWCAMRDEPDDFENTVRYLLSKALRIINQNGTAVAKPLSEQERLDASRIRTMLTFIEEHFAEELTIEDIAQSISVSGSVCLRCFHQMLGTTPIQYVKQLRLEKAAERIRLSSRAVREIAMECGFNDASYFTKSFRERMGCTPREYRSLKRDD